MMGAMPIGIPFYYEPQLNGYFSRRFCSDRKDFSLDSLDWLNYMSDDPRFAKPAGGFYTMRCIVNGEKSVKTSQGSFRVDGYVSTPNRQYMLEFNGCYYHSCSKCQTPTVNDTTERDSRKLKALQEVGEVIVIYGCQWQRLKRRLRIKTSPFSEFYYESEITAENILTAIKNEMFFGIVNCDIFAPDSVKELYKEINFPPLFLRKEPKIEDLSEEMRSFYETYGTKPSPQLTVGYNATAMTLSTDYVKFLLDVGFVVSKLHWALEYQKGNLIINLSDKI